MTDINTDGLSLTELVNHKAAFRSFKNRSAELEKQVDEAILDRMDAGESRNAMIDGRVVARVEKTRGSSGRGFKVKDPLAYGAWLHANGYDDDVYAAPLPTDVAKTKAFMERVVAEHDGVLPDGVDVDGGRGSTVKITLDKDAYRDMWSCAQLPSSMNLLLENGGVL